MVTFKDGAATLGIGALAGNQASFTTTSSLSVASHTISAVYGGDGNFTRALRQLHADVSKPTRHGAEFLTNPACSGQTMIFIAAVSAVAPGAGTPSGTVTFRDGGRRWDRDAQRRLATLTNSTFAVGNHAVTATYNGTSSFNTSVR